MKESGRDVSSPDATPSSPHPPHWPFIVAVCAFALPIGCAGAGIVELLWDAYLYPVTLSALSHLFLINCIGLVCGSGALTALVRGWRWFCRRNRARQWLLAGLCWVLTVLAFSAILGLDLLRG